MTDAQTMSEWGEPVHHVAAYQREMLRRWWRKRNDQKRARG